MPITNFRFVEYSPSNPNGQSISEHAKQTAVTRTKTHRGVKRWSLIVSCSGRATWRLTRGVGMIVGSGKSQRRHVLSADFRGYLNLWSLKTYTPREGDCIYRFVTVHSAHCKAVTLHFVNKYDTGKSLWGNSEYVSRELHSLANSLRT